ncbi:Protein kinase protein rad53 [Vermiconidia calcicola]|uniref:Protein kinase protein rad53 n=1 Tax=Vermiconidia calcicola TaxID=1690605 RepID=A0ACC3NSL9_9PEZI|nr:Protein kinase protein rad53 [Vermiconidia calcicola]
MDYEDATQCTQNTQGVVDPRRMGRNNSGLCAADISDVMCILHPCSPAAFKIVATTAERTPQNVLQNAGFDDYDDGLTQSAVEEQETFILSADAPHQAMDLALRFSAPTRNPKLGFVFGRNADSCDIVLATDTYKRVSNVHFSVFINNSGVLMLQDMSTNGTIVDDVVLKGKTAQGPQTRMLNPGSIIQILSPKTEEIVKFIVRIPSREGYYEEYEAKFQAHMHRIAMAEAMAKENTNAVLKRLAAAQQQKNQGGASIKAPLIQNQYGMHWSGGDKYNIVGLIGKGAFATVYQIATKNEGQLFAAKELEKRKFMKNGILDRKLDNEMQIMKAVSHRNIVQYVDYQDHVNHMYIIMEFVPCGDLQQYLSLHGPLREPLAKDMAAQVLDALAYLHRMKITHRDIKPDNILLANLDPWNFTIKLSDFGLSKVVKDNDTFLKTFCGTLLYCAPEVFPHYDAHVAGKGKKRPRQSKTQPASKFHSYSQTVDIWSFGGVLWYSLCTRPPFEGVADGNGRGMFEKIMMTPLDATDLVKQGVSDDAVALLCEMLNTDPAARPSPAMCRQHQWFDSTTQTGDSQVEPGAADQGLVPIAEEEEGITEDEPDEPDVSGLSLDEQDSNHESGTSEVSIHSGSLEFLDPRQSKRFKSELHEYRDPDDMFDSSPELFHQSIVIMHQPNVGPVGSAAKPQRQRLFGEITQSALQSSALLGQRASDAIHGSTTSDALHASTTSEDSHGHNGANDDAQRGAVASPSLLGAESMVRDLNMDSPHSANSQGAEQNEPATPRTRATAYKQSNGSTKDSPAFHDDATPKQPQRAIFDRQINIPIPASSYYVAGDPSTHTLEYASKVSGHDYVANPSFLGPVLDTSLPATMSGSATDKDATENEEEVDLDCAEEEAVQAQSPPSDFIKPLPRLGRLTSTKDSFESITLNLSSRISTWGRAPSNTHPYPNKQKIEIPKRGITIWFHAKGIDKIPEEDQAWMKRPDLHCIISTESSRGILVNGVRMQKGQPGKTAFGRIYTGDEVVILQKSPTGEPGLKFVCEFFHGEAKQKRPEGAPRFLIETEGGSHRTKGKEKENIAVSEKVIA